MSVSWDQKLDLVDILPQSGAKRVQRPQLKALGSGVLWDFPSVGFWWTGLTVGQKEMDHHGVMN